MNIFYFIFDLTLMLKNRLQKTCYKTGKKRNTFSEAPSRARFLFG